MLTSMQTPAVPTANPKRLTATANRLILAPDERSVQVDLVRLDRTVAVGLRWNPRSLSSVTNSTCCGANSRRLAFGNVDCLVFAGLYRVAPGVLDALKILKPQTVICWHRGGFRAYWRWKSRPRGGRPKNTGGHLPAHSRHEHCEPAWGVPRIHGELLKLGFAVAQSTVARSTAHGRLPPCVWPKKGPMPVV